MLGVQAALSLCVCVSPPISLLARFLVHRYSVLQQHAEANGVEGMDALDTAGAATTKGGYHDDSDEVSVGVLCVSSRVSPPLR